MDRLSSIFLRLFVGLLLSGIFQLSMARDYYWTVQVKAGHMECFFEPMVENQEADIEYQVLEGGELDINILFQAPSGKFLIQDMKSQDGVHTVTTSEKGDHKLCIDNTFSSLTDKLVFVDLGFDRDDSDVDMGNLAKDAGTTEEVASMQKSLGRVKDDLNTIIDVQAHLRAREARHRHTADSNNARVLSWSMWECIAMLTVGSIQVFMVRRLFGSHSKTTA